MNIFVIICSIILPGLPALHEINTRFCINCKFFTNSILTHTKYGKCTAFPKPKKDDDYLVTGIKQNIENYYCSVARNSEDMCGKEGKKYVDK
jgi:hypothetical protein